MIYIFFGSSFWSLLLHEYEELKVLGAFIMNNLEIIIFFKKKIKIYCLRTSYNDEEFSFNVLLVKNRRNCIYEKVFNIWQLKRGKSAREGIIMDWFMFYVKKYGPFFSH